MKQYVLKSLALSLTFTLTLSLGYVLIEPQFTQAASANDTVVVTLNVDAGISITSPADTSMSNSLGVSVNVAVATTTWNIKTNSGLGYAMTVAASTNPAMKSGSLYVDDYSTTTMPSTWSVASGAAKFGFTATGTDVSTATWGTGNYCNGSATSTVNTTKKYYGFHTTATTTSTRASTTTPSGIDTTICYAVEQNGMYIGSGVYTATITATATTL